MNRVLGIGGVFFKARDPESLREWYRRHLGIEVLAWGGAIFPPTAGVTVWSIFPASPDCFGNSTAPFMINYRVGNLAAVLAALREEGCAVEPETQESPEGRFGWVMDPEGNRVELWEPPAGAETPPPGTVGSAP